MRTIKPTVDTVRQDRDRGWGRIPTKGGERNLTVVWNLSENATKERVCKLIVGDKEVYVQVDELQKCLRWV